MKDQDVSPRKLLGIIALALLVGGCTTYWRPGPNAQGTFEQACNQCINSGAADCHVQCMGTMSATPIPSHPAAGETIQLERQHGVYMVPVRINETIILPFVIDSGSAEVSIPTDVFLTLLRSGTVKKGDFIGTGAYILADGSERSSDRFILHEVSVGGHVVNNVVANVAPVKGDPLLGQSFLSKLPSWAIDNQQHLLGHASGEFQFR
jgi:predicted aspartyl protease